MLERISRLERGMVNMQEQMSLGFSRISNEIRSLSGSATPQISQQKRRQIENIKIDDDDDYQNVESERDEYEHSYSDEQEKVQKQLVKQKRKEIKVRLF